VGGFWVWLVWLGFSIALRFFGSVLRLSPGET